MPVTLTNIIVELEKLQRSRRAKYNRFVREGRMVHYTRDSKLAALDTLIELCKKARQQKTLLSEQLNQLSA